MLNQTYQPQNHQTNQNHQNQHKRYRNPAVKVLCQCSFLRPKVSLEFNNWRYFLRQNFLENDCYYDDYVKQLINNGDIEVNITMQNGEGFKIAVKPLKSFVLSELENVCRSIAASVWKWEAEMDRRPFRLGYFSYLLIRSNKPALHIIEDNLTNTSVSTEEYEEAFRRELYWNYLSSSFEYVKRLSQKRHLLISVKVLDDYRFRVENSFILTHELFREFVLQHPYAKYTTQFFINSSSNSTFAVYEAVRKMVRNMK